MLQLEYSHQRGPAFGERSVAVVLEPEPTGTERELFNGVRRDIEGRSWRMRNRNSQTDDGKTCGTNGH